MGGSMLVSILNISVGNSEKYWKRHFYFIICNLVKLTRTYMGHKMYEGWNFNSGNYLFTTDTK